MRGRAGVPSLRARGRLACEKEATLLPWSQTKINVHQQSREQKQKHDSGLVELSSVAQRQVFKYTDQDAVRVVLHSSCHEVYHHAAAKNEADAGAAADDKGLAGGDSEEAYGDWV